MNDIELEFFKTFEIEPIPIKNYGFWLIKGSIIENNKGEKVVYPEITDKVLLELICVLNKYQTTTLVKSNYNELKNEILRECYICHQVWMGCKYDYAIDYKQQVQRLFKKVER